ncbi:dTDP-4-dehydrorhamnose reductase [Candidatus Methylopumilus universalis]|jgi:dTDP-4-dehydrorhamnose reductase|uniref:dTDP-4-dehydrorhamnose reductase n=1 Tax=Candidatus Methylopumilus universalis TaxID=2588536 RepID=UPI00111E1B7B|nr:dTDP-4-dehydrorhamnose reductase [Candidatus Methylopumilus universalis]QDC80378.1 dTDP-4-dehydrorhamnose reductase [Candidatus Methylopumilus universalis]QDC81679.1 dTDP-4-dehydrorhamnose reductase [Candidatus Methylopumilus universalis]QDC88121.1 dTDP-4-dehydrorhamnose reductase [Candidatus Methylopumilus universalis]
MKILLTGKNGQVGFELAKKLSTLGEVIATDREELDLANPDAIRAFIDQTKPDIIINPAAYTAVDKAESEPDLAYKINVTAPEVLAEKASELNIPLVHFSTDYVFDGLKKEAYVETDPTNPQSVYGKTKHDGEEKIRAHAKHVILRTSWVFGSHGNNFLKTILRLILDKESLNIVGDQWGSPASSSMLADVTLKIVDTILKNKNFNDFGTYHLTNEGETNWYAYASFIASEAMKLNLKVKCAPNQIHSILTSEYPTAAERPLNSRLNTDKIKKTFVLELPHWESEVKKVLREVI